MKHLALPVLYFSAFPERAGRWCFGALKYLLLRERYKATNVGWGH
jgi:hypothetical protein